MADEEKVFSIKFDITRALVNLEKMDKRLNNIERSNAHKTVDKLSKSSKNAASSMDKVDKSARRASVSIKQVGQNLRRYVALPLIALGGVSIKFAVDLNKSMANVSTLLTGTAGDLNQLKRGVQDMAKDTGKSTKDLADGLYQVVSALGESNLNMAQLGIASKAAVAGVAETKDAINLLSAAGKGYNDVSEESLKKTSDLAFQTVKLGVTTFPELAASMGRVIPLAAALNTSQEELFATMATLTGVTGNTAEVSTQVASVYSAFLKPTAEMTRAVNKLGFESASAMMKELGFKKSIEALNKSVGGSEDKLAKMLKRKEALLAVLPLVSSQSDNYNKKLLAMQNAAGSTDEAFRKQTEGINAQGHSWEQTKQRMIVFAQRVGDRLLPVLGRLMDYLEPVLEYIENLDDESIDTAISMGKLALQFVAIVTALEKMNSLAAAAPGILGSMSSGMAGAANQAGVLGSQLNKLQAGVALIGAAALGYTIGQMLQKGFIEPAEKRKEKAQNQIDNIEAKGTIGAGKKSIAELSADIARKKRLIKSKGETSYSTFTGGFSSGASIQKGDAFASTAGARKAVSALEAELESRLQQGATGMFSEGYLTGSTNQYDLSAPLQTRGSLGGGARGIQSSTTIHVNGVTDPVAVGIEVRRQQKIRDREVAAMLKGDVSNMAAGEL